MPLDNYPYEYSGNAICIVSRDAGSSRKHKAKNRSESNIIQYKVDGVIIRQNTACDFIVTNEKTKTAYLIELKGCRIADAAVQLMSTADTLRRELEYYSCLNFRIVASKCTTHQLEDIHVKKLRRRYRKQNQVVIKENLIREDI